MMNNKITPELIYQILILKILVSQGGSAETNRIMEIIWRDYRDKLSEKDRMDYEISKEPRWKNHVRFTRQHLIDIGYLVNNSPRGIWEITEEGRQWVELLKQELARSKEEKNE
jgi:hypothetical protein